MNTLMKKIVSFILILLLLTACNTQKDTQDINDKEQPEKDKKVEDIGPVKGGTVTLQSVDPDTLNPILTKNKTNAEILGLVFESLIKYDDKMDVQPSLAERWEASPDGMTWTFFLRKDVKWHDNVQFTAKDVEYTFKTISSNTFDSVYKLNTQHISYFGMVDDYTFKVVLSQPYGGFISALNFPIIASHQFQGNEEVKNDPNFKPMGTGPYKFIEYSPLKEIKLQSNTQWWGEAEPYIDNVVVKIFADNDTALYALEAKEIDFVPTNVVDWEKYSGKDGIQIKEYTTNYYEFMGINFNNTLLQDKNVRKAMVYAIDRDKIIDEVLLGHGKKADVPISPEWWMYDPSSQIYNYNKDKAKQLLSEAGWTDSNNDGILDKVTDGVQVPLAFELLTNSDNIIRDKTANMIEQQLRDIGIRITQKKVSWEELNSLLNAKTFDIVLTGLNFSPIGDLTFAFHSLEIERGTNFISYNDPEMDQLLARAFAAVNQEERKQAYSALQKKAAEDLPFISLYFRTSAILYNERLRGEINPTATNIYNAIDKWYLLKE
ncbi:ABC transporter substrate-binding protein [Petroclostridium sp. X23]|uniref:ABC transporter substrate-binding protein n=1 Tax=Petroclostridium sp. X23 TaxID=3045146 RepID=UPI0024ADE54A|nr:ABC transporter substrate-binding protein [Petroclostridium sp. X23]WHH59000.1 ABC transporter substrate-binding protein [Petroclostridium sp. X23]